MDSMYIALVLARCWPIVKVMIRQLTIAIFVFALAAPVLAPAIAFGQERIEVAQEKKQKTLWDMLFGPKDKEPVVRRTKRKSSSSGAAASLPKVEPAAEKTPGATRLAVFGDSLAIDLAKAMERFYREDSNLVVVGQGVGSSGFVRDDFFDWNAAIDTAIAEDSFDIAVVIMGINDRQNLQVNGSGVKPLTAEWKEAYSARLSTFLQKFRSANKPIIWIELPPMQKQSYSVAITQISSLQRLVAFSGGAEFIDIYERFADENGDYAAYGPDLNGQTVQMRKGDGIHFSSAGSDKLAFYINQSLKLFYRGGTISVAVTDPLAGTDALALARLPLQGLGQIRLLEVAGAVIPLGADVQRSGELFLANPAAKVSAGFDLDDLMMAPTGRADAFGVGVEPGAADEEAAAN